MQVQARSRWMVGGSRAWSGGKPSQVGGEGALGQVRVTEGKKGKEC